MRPGVPLGSGAMTALRNFCGCGAKAGGSGVSEIAARMDGGWSPGDDPHMTGWLYQQLKGRTMADEVVKPKRSYVELLAIAGELAAVLERHDVSEAELAGLVKQIQRVWSLVQR